MGTVYRAEHLKLARKVALKVLLTEHGHNATVRARFEREAKALAALSHPNVITVTDYGVADDLPYIVMELLEGRTLKDRLEEGPLAPDEAFRTARELLRGLAYAHAEGVAHRDLKPANVFLQSLPDGREHVKLLDFGLAKFAHDTGEGAPLTKLGSVLGTPAYMAPEQASGDASDARSDVYAAGIVILEMLAGRRPFDGEHTEVLRQQLLSPLPSVATLCPWREGSPALESFLARAGTKERDSRFQSASEMLAAFDALPQPAVRERAAAPRGRAGKDVLGTAATVPGTVEAAHVRSARSGQVAAPAAKRSGGGAFAAVLGAAALVVLALGALLVGVVVWLSVSGDDDVETTSVVPPDPETEIVPATATPTPVPAPRPTETATPLPTPTPTTPTTPTPITPTAPTASDTPEDPWAVATPRLLADVKRAVDANRRVSGRIDGRLIAYARDHRDDPRPHILLGRVYLARGWRPDAMERFEVAYRTNVSATGDPKMLEALVALAAHARTSSRATTLLRDAFGARGLAAIDAALASGDLDEESAERLARVRGRLM
jgi:serine/threonine-protein kinase